MRLSDKIKSGLFEQGVDFVHFLDISDLSIHQNKGYSNAILFGIALTPAYIQQVSSTPAYVRRMIEKGDIENDEFHLTELKTDRLADELASFLKESAFDAYSQSEKNLEKTGSYDLVNKSTPLPHKILAGMAGLGWIGRNNLLVSQRYGCAISMCSVLTNLPLPKQNQQPISSGCGSCMKCVNVCNSGALKGKDWDFTTSREEIVDVFTCTPCIECMMVCPWTQKYMHKNL